MRGVEPYSLVDEVRADAEAVVLGGLTEEDIRDGVPSEAGAILTEEDAWRELLATSREGARRLDDEPARVIYQRDRVSHDYVDRASVRVATVEGRGVCVRVEFIARDRSGRNNGCPIVDAYAAQVRATATGDGNGFVRTTVPRHVFGYVDGVRVHLRVEQEPVWTLYDAEGLAMVIIDGAPDVAPWEVSAGLRLVA